MKFASALLVLASSVTKSVAFQPLQTPSPTTVTRHSSRKSSDDYLSTVATLFLQLTPVPTSVAPPADPLPAVDPPVSEEPIDITTFSHAPYSYFSVDQLTPKGPRKNADVGAPHDSTRPLAKLGNTSVGSWWCAAGGWPSPALRVTTEVFFVFSGQGAVTDLDGTRHDFGPGDTVILPKGWSGRWGVVQDIHKVWVVHDHPNVEETGNPIRAVITPYSELVKTSTLYEVGPTKVTSDSWSQGSFALEQMNTEAFFVLEGLFFLTNADGTARRCIKGDTVALPEGWSGHCDVIEPVKKLTVAVQ